jgi:hypothetical protein
MKLIPETRRMYFGFIFSKTLNVCLAPQSFTFERHLMKAIPEMHRPH